jgi:hypothetical protein
MSLGNKQRKFTLMVAQLIQWAYDNGYELTVGDAYRDPRLHGQVGEKKGYGASSSCHKLRLAIDLNLFIDGVYQMSSEAYTPLGEYWESIGGSWGGRFEDGNHFSVEWEGKK